MVRPCEKLPPNENVLEAPYTVFECVCVCISIRISSVARITCFKRFISSSSYVRRTTVRMSKSLEQSKSIQSWTQSSNNNYHKIAKSLGRLFFWFWMRKTCAPMYVFSVQGSPITHRDRHSHTVTQSQFHLTFDDIRFRTCVLKTQPNGRLRWIAYICSCLDRCRTHAACDGPHSIGAHAIPLSHIRHMASWDIIYNTPHTIRYTIRRCMITAH